MDKGLHFWLDLLHKRAHDIISMLMLSLAQKPPLSPARELGFAIHDVARLLRTYSDQRARELGTTRAQWAVLSSLQRCEGVKQNELAEALDLAPITVGRLIDKLTAAGLVERRDDAAQAQEAARERQVADRTREAARRARSHADQWLKVSER